MIYGDSFNSIFDAIERIERHVGLRFFEDLITVNGRLNNIEDCCAKQNYTPYCEVDIPISGNTFVTKYPPLKIGDAWVVDNKVRINDNGIMSFYIGVSFNGNIGSLDGADNSYDGKLVTLTYFYNQNALYYEIYFSGGYPGTRRKSVSRLDLVVKDEVLNKNQRVFIDSIGRVSCYTVDDNETNNNIFIDEENNNRYELFSNNGNLNWRLV